MKKEKLLARILANQKGIGFHDMTTLAESFGFSQVRQRGSHHIFSHPRVPELLNLQEVRGEVKPYQVRQFLILVERYDLTLGEGQ